MMYEFHSFETQKAQAKALSSRLADHFASRIAAAGQASWAVSGGSTPRHLFQEIRSELLGWEHMKICLVDERWVSPAHPRSNETFIRTELLKDKASAATFTGMWRDTSSPAAALDDIETDYRALPLPFDAIVLGMGNDGHTASLFPKSTGLSEALDLERENICAAIEAKPSEITGDETQRVTLTARAINDARLSCLMITGKEKRDIFETSLHLKTPTPICTLTSRLAKPLQVYWAP